MHGTFFFYFRRASNSSCKFPAQIFIRIWWKENSLTIQNKNGIIINVIYYKSVQYHSYLDRQVSAKKSVISRFLVFLFKIFYWTASSIFTSTLRAFFSQFLKLSSLIWYLTSSFSTLYILLVLYSSSTLVRSKTDHATVVWNSVTFTDSSELDKIQGEFAVLRPTTFLNDVCDYINMNTI